MCPLAAFSSVVPIWYNRAMRKFITRLLMFALIQRSKSETLQEDETAEERELRQVWEKALRAR